MKREATKYTINNETHTVKEWAEISGVPVETLRKRFYQSTSPDYLFHNGNLKNVIKTYKSKYFNSDIDNFIKENHARGHKWIKDNIKELFALDINLHTIRSRKKKLDCLTDWQELRNKMLPFIKDNYSILTDEELALILSDKIQRNISKYTIENIRTKNGLFRPKAYPKKDEIRLCKQCGKPIKIYWRNPYQVFCNSDCFFKYTKLKYAKRNQEVATPERVKEFIKEYTGYVYRIIELFGSGLTAIEKDEVHADLIENVPYILYAFSKKEGNDLMRKGYIKTAIKHYIYKKFKEKRKRGDRQARFIDNYTDFKA